MAHEVDAGASAVRQIRNHFGFPTGVIALLAAKHPAGLLHNEPIVISSPRVSTVISKEKMMVFKRFCREGGINRRARIAATGAVFIPDIWVNHPGFAFHSYFILKVA
ncbi:MAG: hypothetical protein CM15mP83_5360 [Flavobacteriaceae bacterium]|nr:MAG: hypothetical protein CM15mP83_5360 [Flavobacteriaceae bacterium]